MKQSIFTLVIMFTTFSSMAQSSFRDRMQSEVVVEAADLAPTYCRIVFNGPEGVTDSLSYPRIKNIKHCRLKAIEMLEENKKFYGSALIISPLLEGEKPVEVKL